MNIFNYNFVLLIVFILFSNLVLVGCIHKKSIKWDLTYQSLLNEKSEEDKWLIEWLDSVSKKTNGTKSFISPVSDRLEELNNEKILSAILIEGPMLHAAEHSAILLVKAENVIIAEYYHLKRLGLVSKNFPPDLYKKTLATLSEWKQAPARIRNNISTPNNVFHPGYFAIISLISSEVTKQFKITFDEYYSNYQNGHETPGKFFVIWKELATNLKRYGEYVQ